MRLRNCALCGKEVAVVRGPYEMTTPAGKKTILELAEHECVHAMKREQVPHAP